MAAPSSVWRNPIHFFAYGFGSGAVPKAPGTAGTLVAVIMYLLLPQISPLIYVSLLLISFVFGVWICGKTAQDIGIKDPSGIVWDEFVGYWITMFMAPSGWIWVIIGFVLFRLLDIVKPWPIKWADKQIGGGMGIMLDDVLAGIMAALCMQAIVILLP
ncbi:MAG TPA: phosphatidylglycerophosphatase A [Porticoccaceae bacterium]|jgi:phosphatidylglycerophosphatase A|nr:phosphatidylglycerophosphatase A [Gammaproteobacteria bacterium]HIL60825.1 phosphatidylglycerophosphatase A [Porticoccaceae bacterium]